MAADFLISFFPDSVNSQLATRKVTVENGVYVVGNEVAHFPIPAAG